MARSKLADRIVKVKCAVPGCKSRAYLKQYCSRHYSQIKTKGYVFGNPRRHQYTLNNFRTIGSVGYIFLYNKKGEYTRKAIIDKEDIKKIKHLKWRAGKTGVQATIGGKTMLLHRMIMNVYDNAAALVDHINHDVYDNRKGNLRLCTPAQNNMNRFPKKRTTSKFKGVCFDKSCNKWKAQIGFNRKRIHLGNFNYEIDAAKAYDDAAKKYFGEFALLNKTIFSF